MANALGYVNKRSGLYGRKSILNFGKYKDRTIADVLIMEPDYLIWVFNNIEGFDLEPDVLEEAEERDDEHYRLDIQDFGVDPYDWDD